MHCTDEELLAHLDGELPLRRLVRIRYHLYSCWRCRTRRAGYEKEIQQLTVASDEWPFPEPRWEVERKRRLARGIEQVEASFSARRFRTAAGARVTFRPFAAGAAILACAGLWFGITRKTVEPLRPTDVISRTANVEKALYAHPVHQTFSVEIDEVRPLNRRVNDELHVWSDSGTGRFATRLTGPGRTVKHALWKPERNKEFVYRPAVFARAQETGAHRASAVSLESLADYGLEPAQLEAGFSRWIETRAWSPISFASDMAIWSSRDGVILRAEGIRNRDGSAMIRLTAQRTTRRMTAILCVDVESQSFMPKLQTLRFETPERAVEFRLTATNIRTLEPSELVDAVFRPDGPLQVSAGAPAISLPAKGRAVTSAVTPQNLAESEANARAVEARYVLHQAEACLGEPVTIVQETGGVRIVRRGASGGSWPETFVPGGDLGEILGALADLRRANAVRRESAYEGALKQAWALRRLAEDFPAVRTSTLPTSSWRLLETMVRAHSTGLNRELEGLNIRVVNMAGKADDLAWRDAASGIFARVLRMRDLTDHVAAAESARLTEEIQAEASMIAAGFSREFNKAQIGALAAPPVHSMEVR